MPRGDRTGPMGQGPMTGRGMGYCAGYDMPGFLNRPVGYGGFGGRGRGGYWGRGMGGGGFGRGWRHRYYATGVPGWMAGEYPYYGPPVAGPENELKALEEEAVFLEKSLEEVKKRLAELEAKDKEK
jgi:hypothetical protein